MNWIELIGMTLIHFIWQGAALMLLALALLLVLRRRSAQARYLACCLVLTGMAVAPVVTSVVLAPSCRVLETSHLGVIHHTPSTVKTPSLPSIEPTGLPVDEGILKLIVVGWTIGAGALAIRVCGGFFSLNRLKRTGLLPVPPEMLQRFNELAARMKLRRIPRLHLSNLVTVPTVIGAFRGIVLLPASVVARMSPEMLESILVHELAHVTRYDFLINALQSAIEVVLFYHPAVWWVSQRIREERENCCDDLVIATLSDRKTYARALTTLAELRGHSLAVRADGGELLVRVRRILGETPMKSIVSPLPVALLLGGLILVPALQSFANPPAAAFLQKKQPTRTSQSTSPKAKQSKSEPAKATAKIPARKSAVQDTIPAAKAADGVQKTMPAASTTMKEGVAKAAATTPVPISDNAIGVSNSIPSANSSEAAKAIGQPTQASDRTFSGEPKDAQYYQRMRITIEMDSLLESRQTIVTMQRQNELKRIEFESKALTYSRAASRSEEAKQKAWEAQMEIQNAEELGMLLEKQLAVNSAKLEELQKQLEAIRK